MKAVLLPLAVLSLALPGCSDHRTPASALINVDASLPGGLPYDPLRWRIIDSTVDQRAATMSTLFGNDPAVDHARADANGDAWPPGSVLALVTWEQQSDPRWFGAQIPGRIKSIEFVSANSTPGKDLSFSYQRFEGAPLRQTPTPNAVEAAQVRQILGHRSAVMPDLAQPSFPPNSRTIEL
jgi:hypothetical protein